MEFSLSKSSYQPNVACRLGLDPKTNKATHKFFSFFGVIYVIVNSKKENGNALKDNILKDIVPRGLDVRIEEIQKKHQQAIKKKDATISLLNDDLKIANTRM